jgi:predicted ester cyclase
MRTSPVTPEAPGAVDTVLAAKHVRHPRERESRGKFLAGTSRNGGGRRLRSVPQKGRYTRCTDEETIMSTEENKAIVGRWFTEFWGKEFNPAVIDELAAPDIRFEYSLHEPLRGRDAVRAFAQKFRAAFPDLNFWGTADLIAEADYVVGQWEGGGTHTGDAFDDMPYGPLPASTGKTMRFTGTTVLKVENGLITAEIGLDDGVTALSQLGLITGA